MNQANSKAVRYGPNDPIPEPTAEQEARLDKVARLPADELNRRALLDADTADSVLTPRQEEQMEAGGPVLPDPAGLLVMRARLVPEMLTDRERDALLEAAATVAVWSRERKRIRFVEDDLNDIPVVDMTNPATTSGA